MFEKFRRLKRMGPEELWTKVRNKVQQPCLRLMSNRGLIKPLPPKLSKLVARDFFPPRSSKGNSCGENDNLLEQSILELFKTRNNLDFFSFSDSKESILSLLDEYCPQWRRRSVAAANKICDHRFSFFKESEFTFPAEIEWHLDYTTGKLWPRDYSCAILYRGPEKVGDIKYPWELSRHQYLTCLGKAYWATGDEKYAQEFIHQVQSWIDKNPYLRGVHWISALESAIRIISWLWSYFFFKDSPYLTPSFFSRFLRSVWLQLAFIERNLSKGSHENNHLIGEGAGLFIGGLFLHGFRNAEKWTRLGQNILCDQVIKQTYPDGVNVEQAFHYQCFSMDFFVLFKVLYNQNLGALPTVVDERIEKMFDFLLYAIRPDGSEPAFGDCDNARGVPLNYCQQFCLRDFIGVGAGLFGRSDMKWMAKSIGEEAIWLLGVSGCRSFYEISPHEPEHRTRLFLDGGYYVCRDSWAEDANYLLFDCGALGYGSGAHGHADALSIHISTFGREGIVDPGTYAYNLDQGFRNYFRSTRAHNTITVDGQDQARITDRMSWETIPDSEVTEYYSHDLFDMISARHFGYHRLASPVTHQRKVIFVKEPLYYLIIDRLIATGLHSYEMNYHFPPKTTLQKNEHMVTVSLPSGDFLFLQVQGQKELQGRVRHGDSATLGWYSRMYGHMEASPTLCFSCTHHDSLALGSFIMPMRAPSPEPIRFSSVICEGTAHLTVHHPRFYDTWILQDRPKEWSCEDLVFSGRVLIRRTTHTGSPVFIYALETTALSVGGEKLFQSETPFDGFISNKNDMI